MSVTLCLRMHFCVIFEIHSLIFLFESSRGFWVCFLVFLYSVCVCVCVREREREREVGGKGWREDSHEARG